MHLCIRKQQTNVPESKNPEKQKIPIVQNKSLIQNPKKSISRENPIIQKKSQKKCHYPKTKKGHGLDLYALIKY